MAAKPAQGLEASGRLGSRSFVQPSRFPDALGEWQRCQVSLILSERHFTQAMM
jgi:hypothetical protein